MHHLDKVSGLTSGCKLRTPNVSKCASFHTNESGFVIAEVTKIHICFGETNKSEVQFTQHVRTLHARPHRLQSTEKSQFNGN